MSDDIQALVEVTSKPVSASEVIQKTLPPGTKADDLLDFYVQEESAKENQLQNNDSGNTTKNIPSSNDESDTSNTEGGDKREAEGENVSGASRKGKLGDKEIDIPDGVVFTEKIGDKEVSFKQSDAIKAFLGQEEFNRNMDKRLTHAASKERQVEVENKKLQSKYQSLNGKAFALIKTAQSGDPIAMIGALAKMAVGESGQDPVEIQTLLLDKLAEQSKIWTNSTPEQREAFKQKRTIEALEEENKLFKKSQETSLADQQALLNVDTTAESLGLNRKQFGEWFQVLAKEHVGEGKTFSHEDEIEVEDVKQFIENKYHEKVVLDAIKSVASNKVSDEQFIDIIYEDTHGKNLSVDDIKDIVKMVLQMPTKADENLNQKVQQANQNGLRTQSSAVSSSKTEGRKDDPLYNDLEEFFLRPGRR